MAIPSFSTFPVHFVGLLEAGGIEGGWGLLRCFVQLEQVHWLRATRPVCRTTEEERPVRNRLGQVGGTAAHRRMLAFRVLTIPAHVCIMSWPVTVGAGRLAISHWIVTPFRR